MSVSINIKDIENIVISFVKKGISYAVALYPFVFSFEDSRHKNVIETLVPAFGEQVAEKVYRELSEVFKNIDLWTKVIIEGKEISLRDYLRNYISKNESITRVILNEVDKRYNQISDNERKILSVACAIINTLMNKRYPNISVYLSEIGGINISSTDYEFFSPLVSSIIGFEVKDVRMFFYKYLFGFQEDWSSRRHDYYVLHIYPFTISHIKDLSTRVPRYIKIPDKFDIRSILEKLYQKGEYLKLALIEDNLKDITEYSMNWFVGFSGKTYGQLCEENIVEGVIRDCYINPFTYEYIKEIIKELYNNALDNLVKMFRDVFEKYKYSVSCLGEHCTFVKPSAKPLHIYFYPWPKLPILLSEEVPGSVKAVIIQGIPAQSIIQSEILQHYSNRGYLWLFIRENKILVASNTYKHEDHYELMRILREHFYIEAIGPVSRELEEILMPGLTKPTAVTQPISPSQVSLIKRFGGRDLLEDIVASVLYSLGFNVKVDHWIPSRAQTQVEVDVWGEKHVDDIRFTVYVSCKNWDKPVEISIVREEFGRILQLPLIPHVRVIVAPSFTEPAKKEAIADGFVVIETGERAVENNMNRIYKNVYDKLNKLFIGVAPKWMQELAERARKVAEEIRKIGEELEKIAGTPS
jgi:hypothetical protein